ncbi:tubby C-terminal domain-like protein [Lysinibacillus sp. NPDC048646]|uniref:tubby C-terminal domain-like protein n=1 Tax=Lysinibacillus sp. NPDC048646 TaxID=3390574 RepID=UPI003CFEF66F
MKTFTYKQPTAIESLEAIQILNEAGAVSSTVQRIYSNVLKKAFDRTMDYRYFVRFDASSVDGQPLFTCKKMSRRGRVHFRGKDLVTGKDYMIAYDGWQIMIPDLIITDGEQKITLNKEMEDWSVFSLNEQPIARWQAIFRDTHFDITLQIEEASPIQHEAFFIAIGQAVLFVGA